MGVAAALRKVAGSQLRRFGKPATLISVFGGGADDYDADTGTVTRTTVETPVRVLVEHYRANELSEHIRAGDVRVSIAAAPLDAALTAAGAAVPSTADQLVMDDDEYRIVDVRRVEAEGSVVLYQLQARRA